jgi:hypothetical protein
MKMTYEEELTPEDLIYTLHGWEGRDLVFVQRELMSRPIAQTGLTSFFVVVPKVLKKKYIYINTKNGCICVEGLI